MKDFHQTTRWDITCLPAHSRGLLYEPIAGMEAAQKADNSCRNIP
jgi:hypothetical protein